ncbi:hypothetical protein BSKO_08572 [Bryopsis sp. KO-2023]|nr:hypothetical protein BSKO_08572 [Bryopsis sp. KO-2023]
MTGVEDDCGDLSPRGEGLCDSASHLTPAPIVSYHMTRRSLEGHSKQVLFFVHDSRSRVQLAIVGTDMRGTGHFVYESEPEFVAAPPLRCTNRSQVMSWLADLGATQQVEMNVDSKAPVRKVSIRKDSIRKDSIKKELKKPTVDRKYEAVREDTGETHEGYHFRNFYLVGNDGEEMLAIEGQDGPRRDRRYTYCSVSELNSQSFDNTKQCMEWLEWVIGKREKPPLSKRDRKGLKRDAGTALVPYQQETRTESNANDPATVETAFADRSDLLDWVTVGPDEGTLNAFHEWAEKLSGIVVDEQPEEDVAGPNSKWTSSEDAIEILERIESETTSLKLLELTKISRAIAMLKAHGNTRVAALALRITAEWKRVAGEALSMAKSAL